MRTLECKYFMLLETLNARRGQSLLEFISLLNSGYMSNRENIKNVEDGF